MHMIRLGKSLGGVPFVAGMLGGVVATGAVLAVVVAAGGLRSAPKAVTIEEASTGSADASRETRGLNVPEIYERDAPGVVSVSARGISNAPSTSEILKGEGGEEGTASGSGFEIKRVGMILTNWHVVENATRVFVSVGEGSKPVEAHLVGEDPADDVAVLRIPTEGLTLHPLVFGDSSAVRVGEPVVAIGNPFGYTRTLTTGVISARQRQIQAPNGMMIENALQTDTPINPGNSGGPLLNARGQVIGITSQIVTSGGDGGSVGVAFADPIDSAKGELAALEDGQR